MLGMRMVAGEGLGRRLTGALVAVGLSGMLAGCGGPRDGARDLRRTIAATCDAVQELGTNREAKEWEEVLGRVSGATSVRAMDVESRLFWVDSGPASLLAAPRLPENNEWACVVTVCTDGRDLRASGLFDELMEGFCGYVVGLSTGGIRWYQATVPPVPGCEIERSSYEEGARRRKGKFHWGGTVRYPDSAVRRLKEVYGADATILREIEARDYAVDFFAGWPRGR